MVTSLSLIPLMFLSMFAYFMYPRSSVKELDHAGMIDKTDKLDENIVSVNQDLLKIIGCLSALPIIVYC